MTPESYSSNQPRPCSAFLFSVRSISPMPLVRITRLAFSRTTRRCRSAAAAVLSTAVTSWVVVSSGIARAGLLSAALGDGQTMARCLGAPIPSITYIVHGWEGHTTCARFVFARTALFPNCIAWTPKGGRDHVRDVSGDCPLPQRSPRARALVVARWHAGRLRRRHKRAGPSLGGSGCRWRAAPAHLLWRACRPREVVARRHVPAGDGGCRRQRARPALPDHGGRWCATAPHRRARRHPHLRRLVPGWPPPLLYRQPPSPRLLRRLGA